MQRKGDDNDGVAGECRLVQAEEMKGGREEGMEEWRRCLRSESSRKNRRKRIGKQKRGEEFLFVAHTVSLSFHGRRLL